MRSFLLGGKSWVAISMAALCGCSGIANDKEPTEPEATEMWGPSPAKVAANGGGVAPSDAVVLFSGENLDAWVSRSSGGDPAWQLDNSGTMTITDGSGDIKTKQSFGSMQLHIEWRAPVSASGEGQWRGNSGIFFQERYELQILDSFNNPTYANGQSGSIYKQTPPLVNANKAPGQWQAYDVIYHAPKFDKSGNKLKSARITVLHNGVLIQDHTEILGTTEYIGWPKNGSHGKAPLILQDHGAPVSYRNIWVRELD